MWQSLVLAGAVIPKPRLFKHLSSNLLFWYTVANLMLCSMAGKSTILRMLFRFFDTDSGNVSIFFVCELWGLVWNWKQRNLRKKMLGI